VFIVQRLGHLRDPFLTAHESGYRRSGEQKPVKHPPIELLLIGIHGSAMTSQR
jgi:hypothetical protein